jgi:trehalose-6-phosphate synthase
MKALVYALCLYLPVFVVQATPLYLEQLELSTMDEKKLQEAHKQVKDHSEITLKQDLFVSPFHQQSQNKSTDKSSLCSTCHLQPPHNADERKRSFLNMHSRYISCETCHFKPENIQLEYHWLNFNEAGNKISAERITPFYNKEAVIIFSDHELATQAEQTWKNKSSTAASSIEKAKLKLRLHAPLSKKGPECLDCHNNKDQLLDLKSLGFNNKEIIKLQQHAIPRFFSRFSKEEQRLRMSDLLQ